MAVVLLMLLAPSPARAQWIIIGDPPAWWAQGLPRPPGWEPRDTEKTRYVRAPMIGRLAIPRKVDGNCAQFEVAVNLDAPADYLGGFVGDMVYSPVGDGSCDILIEKMKMKKLPVSKAKLKRLRAVGAKERARRHSESAGEVP